MKFIFLDSFAEHNQGSFNQSINIKNKHRFDFSYNLMKNQNKESKNYNLIYNYFF